MFHAQVIFLHDQQAQVLAVVEGTADVAFVRADQPSVLAAANVISLDQIKILSPVSCQLHSCGFLSFARLAWAPACLLRWLGRFLHLAAFSGWSCTSLGLVWYSSCSVSFLQDIANQSPLIHA